VTIALLVTRPDAAIALSEWIAIVDEDDTLRLRVEPYVAINPRTGEKISIKPGDADAEIQINGEWLPFLHQRRRRQPDQHARTGTTRDSAPFSRLIIVMSSRAKSRHERMFFGLPLAA
jgi:hypothetical protein